MLVLTNELLPLAYEYVWRVIIQNILNGHDNLNLQFAAPYFASTDFRYTRKLTFSLQAELCISTHYCTQDTIKHH